MAEHGNILRCRTVSIWLFWALVYVSDDSTGVMAQTRLEFTDAGHTAKEESVLYLFCKIWELERKYSVKIVRSLYNQVNHSEELTSNTDVLMGDNNNVFLAKRTLSDDSDAFLLAMLGVTREDSGEYRCEVWYRTVNSYELITSAKLPIDIQYLPSGQYPVCHPDRQPLTVTWGKKVVFNCSSELSIPPVSLTWKRDNEEFPADSEYLSESESGGIQHKHLTFTPTRSDNGALFVCESFSYAFPFVDAKSCYIGQLVVQAYPGDDYPFCTYNYTTYSKATCYINHTDRFPR